MNRCVSILALLLLATALSVSPALAGEPGTFKPEGKAYFFYTHDASDDDGQRNAFDLSRMYIGTKYFVSEDLTIRYLTDISHESGGGKFEVFTKYAYLEWKACDNKRVLFGLQGTNNWSMPEKAWGYRQVLWSPMESFGKFWKDPAMDYYGALLDTTDVLYDPTNAANFDMARRSGMGSSADIGVGMKCNPVGDMYVNVMIRNGLGYKKAEDDMYKNFLLRAGTYLMDNALHVSAFAELEPWKGVDSDGSSKRYANLQWDAMAAYTAKDKITLGVDINSKTLPGADEDVTAMCVSGFAHGYLVAGKLKALARYDMYDSGFNDIIDGAETNGSRMIVGLDYKLHKNVSIIPNIQIVSYENSDTPSDTVLFLHVYFKI